MWRISPVGICANNLAVQHQVAHPACKVRGDGREAAVWSKPERV
jgi:hypothetical protein